MIWHVHLQIGDFWMLPKLCCNLWAQLWKCSDLLQVVPVHNVRQCSTGLSEEVHGPPMSFFKSAWTATSLGHTEVLDQSCHCWSIDSQTPVLDDWNHDSPPRCKMLLEHKASSRQAASIHKKNNKSLWLSRKKTLILSKFCGTTGLTSLYEISSSVTKMISQIVSRKNSVRLTIVATGASEIQSYQLPAKPRSTKNTLVQKF